MFNAGRVAMADAVSIALSGLTAQGQRLAVSASNIANIATAGAIPTAESPNSNVYKALKVSYSSLMANGTAAGVIAKVSENPAYSTAFDPSSPYANKDGLIALPNVDLVGETVNVMLSKYAYKANLAVIKAEKEMLGGLLNSIT